MINVCQQLVVKVIQQSFRTQQKHIQNLLPNFSLPSQQEAKSQRRSKQAGKGVWLLLASMRVYKEWGRFKKTLGCTQQKDKWQRAPRIEESPKIKTLFILRVARCWIRLRSGCPERLRSLQCTEILKTWVTWFSWPWSSRGGGELESPQVPAVILGRAVGPESCEGEDESFSRHLPGLSTPDMLYFFTYLFF